MKNLNIKINLLLTLIMINTIIVRSQNYPSFGAEINVTIKDLSFDAMEPFISPNGKYLFLNNLNDGVDTKLFYAIKINDSTFNFIGELNGTNQSEQPYLDAVADLDTLNNFYWTSTRDYPTILENLFHGEFDKGNVVNIGRVYGDFNKNIPGWLVMVHGISYDGQFLYYNNARFNDSCQGICETEIGIATKTNDSTFTKLSNSDSILQNINDTNYIYYAPCISSDNLELYYTRYPRDSISSSTLFEICVAVRKTPLDTFSMPIVLFSELISKMIEAPTLTHDKQIIYYHKKTSDSHKIVMRYRKNPLNIIKNTKFSLSIYPNPTSNIINIKTDKNYHNLKLSFYSLLGKIIMTVNNQKEINISSLPVGSYFLKIEIDDEMIMRKIIKLK